MKIRSILAITLVVGLVVSQVFVPSAHANGGYPDWDAEPCPQYGQYAWCKNGQFRSPRGFWYRNCTDWAAWRVTQLGVGTVPGSWGDAGNWDNAAMAAGKTVDTVPEPGDVAV